MQYGFYHDNDICIGCNCCVIACKDKSDLPVGEKFRRVYDYAGCEWNVDEQGVSTPSNYFAYSVSVACNHCVAPACVGVCPVGSMTKDDQTGIVSNDQETCIGCGACANACPYHAPYVSAITKTSRKCDLCKDYLAAGAGESPACVGACPMRCLSYGDIDELRAEHGTVAQVEPLPDAAQTIPSIVFNRSRLNPDGTISGEMLNAPEEVESATVVF